MINARTGFFDEVFGKHKSEIEQIVISGAGFDTRIFKFFNERRIPAFELDLENTQKIKKNALQDGSVNIDWIRFIPIDFNIEDWTEKLKENGYDTDKKTLFLWEGVTYYLPEETINQNLNAMNRILGKGSIVSFDFFTRQWMFENTPILMKYAQSALKISDEEWQYGFDGSSEEATKQQIKNEFLINTDFSIERFERLGKTESNFIGGFVEIAK